MHLRSIQRLSSICTIFPPNSKWHFNNGGKWLITKGACRDQVWNACHGAVDRKVICYASPPFTCVPPAYNATVLLIHTCWRARDGVIQLGNPTRISRSVVTKCQCLIFCLLSFSIWSFLDRCWSERLIWLWSVNQLKPTTSLWSPFGSIGIPLVCTLIASLWTCFEYFYPWYKINFNFNWR